MKLVSACLLGIECRWRGDSSTSDNVIGLTRQELLIPVCPEQLGGLPTPRSGQEIQSGDGESVLDGKSRVINGEGVDVTAQLIRGAEETLRIATLLGVREFIGKTGSPSCGCVKIHDGSFSGKRVPDYGVTAALLQRNGIRLISDDALL